MSIASPATIFTLISTAIAVAVPTAGQAQERPITLAAEEPPERPTTAAEIIENRFTDLRHRRSQIIRDVKKMGHEIEEGRKTSKELRESEIFFEKALGDVEDELRQLKLDLDDKLNSLTSRKTEAEGKLPEIERKVEEARKLADNQKERILFQLENFKTRRKDTKDFLSDTDNRIGKLQISSAEQKEELNKQLGYLKSTKEGLAAEIQKIDKEIAEIQKSGPEQDEEIQQEELQRLTERRRRLETEVQSSDEMLTKVAASGADRAESIRVELKKLADIKKESADFLNKIDENIAKVGPLVPKQEETLNAELESLTEQKNSVLREVDNIDRELRQLGGERTRRTNKLELDKKNITTNLSGTKTEIELLENKLKEHRANIMDAELRQLSVEEKINELLVPETGKNQFKKYIATAFAVLVGVVIVGFFMIAFRDEVVRQAIFSGEAGIQFITLFSLVIAIILFGITGILEGKELSALLGGISGYILGRGSK